VRRVKLDFHIIYIIMELQPIQNRIFNIRGFRVMMDFHLAELYEVETKILNQAVKRNLRRFPADFMIQLTGKEWNHLKTQMAILDAENERSQFVTFDSLKRKYLPYTFTEQGIAMLSSVLKSDRAIDVNIAIMRAFVILRQHITNYQELFQRVNALEKQMNRKFKDIHEALNYLLNSHSSTEIGFRQAGRTKS